MQFGIALQSSLTHMVECNTVTVSLVSCPLLTAPDNGMIDCTGSLFEDTCTFSCDDGYELTGSENRTCQSDQTWSGSDDECRRGWFIYKFLKSRDAFIVKQFPIHLLLILIME